jgi:octaprenyl-diphosphate synthase
MTASAFQALTQGRVQQELLDQLATVVAEVESELNIQTASAVSLIQKVGRLTLSAGGKRLRPAFISLCASAVGGDYSRERVRKLGAVMEMVHMATLIHDDVIDHSPTRRGQPTAARVYGNTESILSGDVLLAKAMLLLAQDGDIAIIRGVSESVVEMAEGEVRELEVRGDFDLDEARHIEVLRLKTASFIRGCCEAGGYLANATPQQIEALREYGTAIGLAFQIVDDVLDYRGKGSETGKAQAVDFREGQATLPLIRLRSLVSEEELQVLRLKFGGGVTDDEIRMICGWMESRGAFTSCEETAHVYLRKALSALEALPPSPSRDLLAAVGDFVIERRA